MHYILYLFKKGEVIMKIIALGGCCKNSQKNYENAKKVAEKFGFEMEHISDMEQIMAYGVMATPALVIDNKVVSTGRVLTEEQIKNIIKKYM